LPGQVIEASTVEDVFLSGGESTEIRWRRNLRGLPGGVASIQVIKFSELSLAAFAAQQRWIPGDNSAVGLATSVLADRMSRIAGSVVHELLFRRADAIRRC